MGEIALLVEVCAGHLGIPSIATRSSSPTYVLRLVSMPLKPFREFVPLVVLITSSVSALKGSTPMPTHLYYFMGLTNRCGH